MHTHGVPTDGRGDPYSVVLRLVLSLEGCCSLSTCQTLALSYVTLAVRRR